MCSLFLTWSVSPAWPVGLQKVGVVVLCPPGGRSAVVAPECSVCLLDCEPEAGQEIPACAAAAGLDDICGFTPFCCCICRFVLSCAHKLICCRYLCRRARRSASAASTTGRSCPATRWTRASCCGRWSPRRCRRSRASSWSRPGGARCCFTAFAFLFLLPSLCLAMSCCGCLEAACHVLRIVFCGQLCCA